MPVLTQLNLNIGTEQNPNMVLHDLHDIRISSTDVTTVTRLLGCDAGVNSIAPLTLANAASLLGVWFFKGTANPSEGIDSLTDPGYYTAWNNAFGFYIVLVFKTTNNRILQIYFSSVEIKFRYYNGSWSNWKSTELS